MEKLLVILNPNHPADIENMLRAAKVGLELPKGTQRILDNSFLIDTHTSLPFFVLLLNTARAYHVRIAVFSVDDDALLHSDPLDAPQ